MLLFHELKNLSTNRRIHSVQKIIFKFNSACLHQCAIVGPCLYIAGGFDSYSCIMDTVHRLDLTNGKWSKLPQMKMKRACFQLVSLGNFLFAIGGLTPGGYTKTIERFDMVSEEWELAAPLKESKYRHAATVTSKGKVRY